MTDENVVEILTHYINDHYLQFSFSKLSDRFDYREIVPKMYKDYSGNYGFVLYYEFDSVKDIYDYFSNYWPFCSDVEYGKGNFNLTIFYDCFLQCVHNDSFDNDKFVKLLRDNGHSHDLTKFMTRKADYSKEYENEVRIIIQREKKMNIIANHISLPFAKPACVCIPSTLAQKDKYTIEKICKKNKLNHKYMEEL